MKTISDNSILERINEAIEAARLAIEDFTPGKVTAKWKGINDPVTAADRAIDDTLRNLLPRQNEGWFSEETIDDLSRLKHRQVWIVDPLDGTREFVAGIPEWAISIAYVEEGRTIAGGVCNPQTGETFVGALGHGVTYQTRPVTLSTRQDLVGATVLASRGEFDRGEWDRFQDAEFDVKPVGSIAYKLALVAAGLADATWTLQPKNEWDVAAGVALINAAGGVAYTPDGATRSFNNENPLMRGLVAHPVSLKSAIRETLKKVGQS
jgi:myo-inositol-1(or 4)-monophosphatase